MAEMDNEAAAREEAPLLRIKQVAKQLELDPAEVSRMLLAGAFGDTPFKIGRRWRIPPEAVTAFVAERQARTRRAAAARRPKTKATG